MNATVGLRSLLNINFNLSKAAKQENLRTNVCILHVYNTQSLVKLLLHV